MIPPLNPLDLVNFGLFLVIWLVQAIIYPGFAHYQPPELVVWHRRYTRSISIFVIPLMLLQAALLIPSALAGVGLANAMLALVGLAWAVTFKFSVALHRRVAQNQDPAGAVQMLIRTNWPRTVLWTAVFLLGLLMP